MKNKLKWFKCLTIPCLTLSTFAFATISCSKKSTSLVDQIYSDALDEFIKLCDYPRPTFHTERICRYISHKVSHDYGLFVRTDFYDSGEPDSGVNLYYDIPATSMDYVNVPVLCIQCHTDMVWVTDSSTSKPIPDHPVPEITKKDGKTYITSKDRLTSLGADNGIGIALALALTKNRDKFEHGVIRILMTTDEEDGESGAASIPWKPILNKIKYLINVDLERWGLLGAGCNGVQQASWSKKLNKTSSVTEEMYDKGVDIIISGLLGGHSAVALKENNNRANSIKVGMQLLDKIISDGNGHPIQLAMLSEKSNTTESATPGTIPNYLHIVLATGSSTYNGDVIQEIQKICNQFKTEFLQQKDHKEETKLQITCGEHTQPGGLHDPLTSEDSQKLISFINNLPYGADDVGGDGAPRYMNNIGCIRLNDGKYAPLEVNDGTVYLEMFGRAENSEKLGINIKELDNPTDTSKWKGFMKEYYDKTPEEWQKIEDTEVPTWGSLGWNPSWASDNDNPLVAMLKSSSKEKTGEELIDYFETGWFEIAEFAKKNKDALGELKIATIGANITDPHTVNECVEFSSLIPITKTIMGVIESINKEVS